MLVAMLITSYQVLNANKANVHSNKRDFYLFFKFINGQRG
jgi:hypothetical protein